MVAPAVPPHKRLAASRLPPTSVQYCAPAIQQAAVDAWSLGSRQDRDRREAMWRGRNSEPERGLRIDCVGSPYSTLGVYLEVISSAICRFKVVRLVRW